MTHGSHHSPLQASCSHVGPLTDPNCLPIPELSRTPNGKTIVGVSRETHNSLTSLS